MSSAKKLNNLISELSKYKKLRIISKTSIKTQHAQLASFFNGEKIPVIDKNIVSNYVNVGVGVAVEPL